MIPTSQAIPEIPVHRTRNSKLQSTDFNALEFGKYTSDHMLSAEYKNGQWGSIEIIPYQNISLAPDALCFHYGQTVFEGMKAFRQDDGNISVFRIKKHYQRLLRTLERMCMPAVPESLFADGMCRLVETDAAWVPGKEGCSLYIRPFMIATEARFGVKISSEYRYIVFTGPVPTLYAKPLRVKVETHYVRAAHGGTGYAKCGGNYGAAYYPTYLAKEDGYDAVLWTDSLKNEFIEESGTMNVLFMINGTLITPPVSDSILDGVTRDSILRIAEHMGIPVEERPISYRELEQAAKDHTLQEAFGAGTAAVIAPIRSIGILGIDYTLPDYTENNFMFRAKRFLNDIRRGNAEDIFHWNTIISM